MRRLSVLIFFLLVGCMQKSDFVRLQELLARWSALPQSTKQALLAKDLVGMSLYAPDEESTSAIAARLFLQAGATRAGLLDATLFLKQQGGVVYVKDAIGNVVCAIKTPTVSETEKCIFALGTERKLKILTSAEMAGRK